MDMHAETARLLHNLIRIGTVAAVDHARQRCRVTSGGNITNWLPWLAPRASAAHVWWPLSVGEQCVVLCPGGDPSCGIALPGIFSDECPPAGTAANEYRLTWENGDFIRHNADTGALDIVCSGPVKIVGDTIDLN